MVQSLLSNNTFFDARVGKNLNVTLETIQEVLQSGRQVACSSLTALWADLFTQVTLVQEDWPALLCNQNQSFLLIRLQKTVDPLITKVYMLIDMINGTHAREVTAPQILSAWETLETSYLKCIEVIGRVTQILGSEYWRAWARNTSAITANWTAILRERTLEAVEQLGSELQASVLWPTVKPYFDTAYWIMAYSSQQNTTAPPNCTFINSTMSLDCSSVFSWKQFVLLTVELSEEVAKDQTSLLRILQARILFVQDSFRSHAAELLRQYLTKQANNQPLRDEVLKELMGMIVQLGESSIELLVNATSLDHLNSTMLLNSVLETFHLLPLEAIWKEVGSSSTDNVSSVLQAVENNQKLLAALNMGPINGTNPSIHELDSWIEKWLSVGSGLRPLTFSIAETLIMFSLNQSELTFFKEMLQPLLQANLNGSHATPLVLQILGVFDQAAQSRDEPLVLLNGYLKQLQNFLNSDLKPETLLLIQNPYIQANSSFSLLLNYDQHQVALDMLPFLSPAALLKWVSLGADAPLTVLQQFVLVLPDSQQVELGNTVNSTARLFEAVNLCRMTYFNCTAVIYETWNVVMQAAEALHDINNDSLSILVGLASHFNNSKLSLKLQENTSLVLTTDLISMLIPLGATTNSSVPASAVYLTVTQTLAFLKQVVSTPDFNMITLQEALETSNLNITELNSVLHAAGAPSASELVLEISSIVGIQECYNVRPNDSLSCTLELTNKLMDLLQRVDLPKEIKGRISAVKSILQYWMEELNEKGSLLRQLEGLYDFTSVSLQDGSLVNGIRTTVTLISDTLMKIQSSMGQLSIESPEQFDTGVKILDEFIQMFVNGTNPYSMTTKTAINSLRLEDIRLYLEITEWYLSKLENVTLQNNISGSLYPLFRITEMALANAVSGIQLSYSLLSMVNMTILPFDVSDLRKVLQFFTQTIMPNVKIFMDLLLSTLPQNSTDPFLKEQFRQYYTQLLDLASALLKPLAPVNISTASVSIEDIVTLLEIMSKNNSEYNMDPHFRLLSKDIETALNVSKLLQEGIQVLATLESEGAANQTLFNLSSQVITFDKLIDYIQPLLPAEKHPYVDMAIRVFEMLWDSVIVATKPGERNAEDIPSLLLDVAKLLLNSTAPLAEQLSEAVVTDLFTVLQGSMQLALSSSESGFPKDRNLTTEVIGRLQNLVRALFPQPAASIIIPVSEVVKIYFETISQDDGLDTWSQIIEQELHSFLPDDSNWNDYISLLLNISALLSQQSQENTTSLGIAGYLLERILGSEGISGNTSLIEVLFEQMLAGWGDASHKSPSPLLQTPLHALASLFADVEHAMGLLNITEAWAERILPALIQLASGAAEEDLGKLTSAILEAVLSSLKETPAWEPMQDILSLEQALSIVVVQSLKVETELCMYVKVLLGNLITSLKRVIQDSGGNLTESIRPILHAVSQTASIIREDLLSGRTVSCGDISRTWSDIMHDELELNQTWMEEFCIQTCFPDDLNSTAGILRQLINTTVSGLGKEDIIDGNELTNDLDTLYQAALGYYESLRHFYTEISAVIINSSPSEDSSIPALIDDLSAQHIVLGVSAALNPFLQQASMLPGLKQHIEAAYWILNYTVQNNYTGQDNCDNSSMSCKGTDELEMHLEKMIGFLLAVTKDPVLAGRVLQLLANTAELVPPELPYAQQFKNLMIKLAKEAQEEFHVLSELSQVLHTMFTTNWAADNVTVALENLKIKKAQMNTVTGIVCELEKLSSVQALYDLVPMNSGIMCQTVSPAIQAVFSLSYSTLNWKRNLTFSPNTLLDNLYNLAVGDPSNYNVNANWSSALVGSTLNFNTSAFNFLNITNTTAAPTKVSDLILNPAAFMSKIHKRTGMPTDAIDALMQTVVPDNFLQLLAWLMDLRHCDSPEKLNLTQSGELVYRTFCKLGPLERYSFTLIVLEHLDLLEFIYKIILTSDMQNLIEALMRLFHFIMEKFQKLAPAIKLLISYLQQIQRLNLVVNSEFKELVAGNRATMSSKATFNTLAGAMCYRGFFSLFTVSQVPNFMDSNPSTQGRLKVDEIIKKFDIPRNATPFCLALYLDMVNTTGGAVAWVFIKPMLLGKILYTPDTPETRAIMEKSNVKLQQLGELKMYAQDWIDATKLIFEYAQMLEKILPLLLRSLQNPFVQHFVKLQTNINMNDILNMLQTYSNLTKMLEENQKVMDQLTVLSQLMLNLSSCVNFNRNQPVSSIAEMNAMAKELLKTKELYASIIFKMPPKSSRRKRSAGAGISLPAEMRYTIRMAVQNSMRTDRIRNPFWTPGSYVSSNKNQRYNRGFINLQESIDRAIIDIQAGRKVEEPAVQLQAFPYPCYFRDNFLNSMSNSFPLALMVAWVLFIAAFVKKLVHERELRLHEYMKMMGVNPSSHFCAWFIESACFLLVTIIIMTIILKAGKIFPNSNGFIIFLFLCDYGFSILAMSFLISAFFDRTNVAGLSGSLIYIICFFPFIVVVTIESSLTFSTKSLLCLFAPTCFSYAGQYIGRYEGQNIGIQWDNSYISPLSNDTTSFGWLCWLLFIDSLVYFTVGWYIRNVFPGKYGIASPWYFPVLPSFWAECCGFNTCRKDSGRGLLFTNIMLQSGNIDHKNKGDEGFTSKGETELEGLPVGVSLHGLTKLFGQTVAIQNLNLNFYEGHVTTLLGHNGAGKTTTMSLLTGLYSPSSGSVLVYGKDMQTHMDAVRRDMGVCMQYDVLFEHLTVREHLLLYGQIKSPGWNKHELNQQVRNTLKETGMYAHRHKRVDTLSGGMKRKLSISIAFIGGSKTVVLDEPTTGVDPCSRRSIWDIVIRHKTGRTIILSTHHLDEAEVLSDRIAFLEHGGLKCCGSPFYLKEKLGQGYNLILTRRMPPPGSEDYCVPDILTRFIQSHMPEAQLKGKMGADLVYALPPFGAQHADAYRSLLSQLDRCLDTLRLSCYGISETTLEEVFLQMTKDNENKDTAWSNTQMVVQVPEDAASSYNVSDRQALTGSSSLGGPRLFAQKVVGMLLKRIHHSRRDWRGLLAQVILPVLFVIAAMGMGTIKNGIQEYPEINLSPALYGYDSQSVFFGLRNPSASDLVSKMMSFPGIDNFCLYNPGNDQCLNKEGSGDWISSGKAPVSYKPCDCNTTVQLCPRDDYVPPHKKAPSLQTVYNLSQLNVENYLLSTANSFIQNRYGGWVFGGPLPVDLRMDFDPVPANRTLTKVWYNPEGYHTMPAYLNSLDNFILRANLPPGVDPQKYAISVYSQPYKGGILDEDTVVHSLVGVLVALCVLTGYSIMTANFVIYEVMEYQTGAKRLQHISGVGEIFYWIVNFMYDMTLYLIPVALSIAAIAAFQLPAFSNGQNLGAVSLLLVLFGFGTFPWMYLLAGTFKNAEMAFICYVSINLFIAINTIISTSVVYFLSELKKDDLNIKEVYRVMSCVFLIFPQFSFGNGLMELSRMQLQVDILAVFGIDSYKSPFSMDVLGWMFVSLAVQGSLCFLLRLLLNTWLLRKMRILMCRMRAVMFHAPDEDPDVKAEQDRVDSGQASGDLLQLNKLCKLYQNIHKKVLAVNNISVGIPAGECFGLLGVNGAGKTTTFKMLTAEIFPSNGNALVKNTNGSTVDIMDGSMEGISIGYCPQVDALDDLLTGEEHLYYYARIRGIPSQQIHSVVMHLLQRLELLPHKDKPTCQYSCGTKRKLSTALALIGSPQILLLDEPSSGMDPKSKRHLWNIISEELKEKCAVVLTSHSMEECEALCTRAAIMVKGRFRCLGSLQHIKNRFGSGFTVKMHLTSNSLEVEHITTFMQSHFPSTFLKDHHSGTLEYHVPVAPEGIADIFDQLERNKASLSIKNFSVSQTTLDEVFINFAKESSVEESEASSELSVQSVNA
ncbi:ATP-binding cassette sub-family A member 12-like [Polyodon spathula]|uniref:ATP-binding cassette sub-family A member 12-like n=1 Tax=Polyodon spathula TaxID=7913 RepID=UPI001B7F35B6|nr:ATP-binding cassette sub-family A member 12-like [Polyodon spathula]